MGRRVEAGGEAKTARGHADAGSQTGESRRDGSRASVFDTPKAPARALRQVPHGAPAAPAEARRVARVDGDPRPAQGQVPKPGANQLVDGDPDGPAPDRRRPSEADPIADVPPRRDSERVGPVGAARRRRAIEEGAVRIGIGLELDRLPGIPGRVAVEAPGDLGRGPEANLVAVGVRGQRRRAPGRRRRHSQQDQGGCSGGEADRAAPLGTPARRPRPVRADIRASSAHRRPPDEPARARARPSRRAAAACPWDR